MLEKMTFTVVMDREIDLFRHAISHGGYELNHKPFDFRIHNGRAEGNLLYADAHIPMDEIVKDDLKGEFQQFHIHTGQPTDPVINLVKIKDLVFYFEDEVIEADERLLESANIAMKKEKRRVWFPV